MTDNSNGLHDDQSKTSRSLLMTFVRIIGWIFVTISAIFILGLLSIYVPCLMGEPNTCISGVILLGGSFFVLIFGCLGLLLLTLARRQKIF